MYSNDGILLESGTGEVEVLHFKVNNEDYAINVVKVKEILNIDNVSKVPNSNAAIPGISLIRGEVVTVIDMSYVLDGIKNPNVQKSMTLVCEFNQLKVAFAIDQVIGINRIGWSELKKPDSITQNSLVIGNINLNGQILMLLDFEKIVVDISPQSGINIDRLSGVVYQKERGERRLILADDSPLIRKLLKETLEKAGYKHLTFFDDGKSAYDYLMDLVDRKGNQYKEDVDLLITDIEMPELDGHTLTRRIKEHSKLRSMPVVIFSSLITNDLKHKGESVGADAQMSKPEIENLVEILDELLI